MKTPDITIFRDWLLAPILKEIKTSEDNTMSALSDMTATLNQALAKLKTDLEAKLADLEAKIKAGSVSPEDLKALQAVVDSIGVLDTEVNAQP